MSDWLTTPETTSEVPHREESDDLSITIIMAMVMIVVLFTAGVLWFHCRKAQGRARQLV